LRGFVFLHGTTYRPENFAGAMGCFPHARLEESRPKMAMNETGRDGKWE
jgi:hypothetical protein